MFCGWGHTRDCPCDVCESCFRMSRKQAYRKALAQYKAQCRQTEDAMLKKPMPGQLYGVADVQFDDLKFRETYPTIYEYLFTQRWQDGSTRVTSTISFFAQEGALKVVINDRDNNRSAFFNAETFDAAMASMEASLKSDTTDWKSRSGAPAKGASPPF